MRANKAEASSLLVILTLMVSLLLINSPASPSVIASLVQGPDPKLPAPQRKSKPPKGPPPSRRTSQPTELPKIVYVSNVSEFIKAIRPGVEIKLKRGVYDLSRAKPVSTQYVRWRKLLDEYEPIISSVHNLTITGEPETKILIAPYLATVLTIEDSAYIRIQNVTLGHSKETGACEGDVLAFRNVSDIEIKNSILFGSGAHGLHLTQTRDLMLTDSTIRGCTEGAVYVRDSEKISIQRSVFKDNRLHSITGEESLIQIVKSEDITFSECNIENNTTSEKLYLFDIDEYSKNVVLNNSRIIGNIFPKFINAEGRLMMSTNTFGNNSFEQKF